MIAEATATGPPGSATAWLWAVSVGPCVHRGWLAACAVGTAGALHARGTGFAVIEQANAPHVSVGARGVLEIPIGDRLRVRWTGELAAPLVTIHLTVDGRDVWSSPRVSALTSLGMAVNFR